MTYNNNKTIKRRLKMIMGINEFNNSDIFELSKVWNNLSDDMKATISEAIG